MANIVIVLQCYYEKNEEKHSRAATRRSLPHNAMSAQQLASLHLASRFTDELTLAALRITPTEKKTSSTFYFRKIRRRSAKNGVCVFNLEEKLNSEKKRKEKYGIHIGEMCTTLRRYDVEN